MILHFAIASLGIVSPFGAWSGFSNKSNSVVDDCQFFQADFLEAAHSVTLEKSALVAYTQTIRVHFGTAIVAYLSIVAVKSNLSLQTA